MHGIPPATLQIPVQRVAQKGHAANGASPPAEKNFERARKAG